MAKKDSCTLVVKPDGIIPVTPISIDWGKIKGNITNQADLVEYIGTENTRLEEQIESTASLIKEKSFAKGCTNYQALVNELNSAGQQAYRVGQSFLIITLDVPDLWVSGIMTSNVPYTYTNDAAIVNTLKTNGTIQFGYYRLSMLETLKQDLTNYVTQDALANYPTQTEMETYVETVVTNAIGAIESELIDLDTGAGV